MLQPVRCYLYDSWYEEMLERVTSELRAIHKPAGFFVQSSCVFMSPVWVTIVCIWKNGFGEAVPQQSGSGVVYMTGMLMQLLHRG